MRRYVSGVRRRYGSYIRCGRDIRRVLEGRGEGAKGEGLSIFRGLRINRFVFPHRLSRLMPEPPVVARYGTVFHRDPVRAPRRRYRNGRVSGSAARERKINRPAKTGARRDRTRSR